MYFEEAFGEIKTTLGKSKVKAKDNHFAIQVRMTDYDCGGTFYIEQKEGRFFVEPYNYFDYDADIEASFKDIKAIADGKLDAKKAVEDGKLIINGKLDELLGYAKQLKKPARKAPAKASAKKPESKPAAKTDAKKTAVKAEAKKTAAKKVEKTDTKEKTSKKK